MTFIEGLLHALLTQVLKPFIEHNHYDEWKGSK